MNNLSLLLSPSDSDAADFIAATVQVKQEGPGTFEDVFGKSWPQGTRHFLPVRLMSQGDRLDKCPADFLPLPALAENEPITHLVLIEGNDTPGDPYFFANQKIVKMGIVVFFSEKTQQFIPLHCNDCVMTILDYVMENQGAWGAQGQSVQEGGATYH